MNVFFFPPSLCISFAFHVCIFIKLQALKDEFRIFLLLSQLVVRGTA